MLNTRTRINVSTSEPKTWTILSIVEWSTKYLADKGFESPRLTVELLLSHVLRCQRIELYTNFDKPLAKEELAAFKSLLQRRLTHEPLDYILGECVFMGLRFYVDKRVYIPRPETEVLVERVIQQCKNCTCAELHILDIGTGSGCIAISLAKFLPYTLVDAIDVSSDALEVAQRNVERHGVTKRVGLIQGDILADGLLSSHRKYDIIVSNPPYISSEEFYSLQPEIKEYEPLIAITDNSDGLTFYRRISDIGQDILNAQGWIFVEVAYNQADDVQRIFSNANYCNIETSLDYSSIKRVVRGQKR